MLKSSDLPTHVREKMRLPAHSKYGVAAKEDRTVDGIVFDSKAEAVQYLHLLDMQKSGAVHFFLRQVPFHLPGGVKYLADFLVFFRDGRIEVQDVKGVRTTTYRLKKRQVEALYPVKIREIAV